MHVRARRNLATKPEIKLKEFLLQEVLLHCWEAQTRIIRMAQMNKICINFLLTECEKSFGAWVEHSDPSYMR